MTMSGLILITAFLANVLTAQAECCKCDCQQSSLHQPQLLYLPVVPTQVSSAGHGIYQSLGQVSVQDSARYSQAYSAGYHSGGSAAAQYQIDRTGIENSLAAGGSKVEDSIVGLGIKLAQQPSFDYSGQGPLNSVLSISTNNLGQHVSKVSNHQGNHYVNIEQQVSPHESSSIHDSNSLEHEKDHHHGKNDHYKFEYGVTDHHTHDIKTHKEEKNGDVVQGEYSLVEDGGNVRTVKYYADWKTGFHAQVHNSKAPPSG